MTLPTLYQKKTLKSTLFALLCGMLQRIGLNLELSGALLPAFDDSTHRPPHHLVSLDEAGGWSLHRDVLCLSERLLLQPLNGGIQEAAPSQQSLPLSRPQVLVGGLGKGKAWHRQAKLQPVKGLLRLLFIHEHLFVSHWRSSSWFEFSPGQVVRRR